MNKMHMTRKEAMHIVIRASKKYCTTLKKQMHNGPEGIEVYLIPFIKDLEAAIDFIQHHGERRSKP